MEEVDLLIGYKDGEWSWWTIVAFSSKNEAINRGRYGVDGYEGCELVPWNTDGRFGRMMELMDEDVTPIAYTEGKPQYPAHAIQEADDIHVLNRMFGLDDLETLEKRRERLFEKVVPREVRWQDKDTSLRDLARDIEDQEDDEDSEE